MCSHVDAILVHRGSYSVFQLCNYGRSLDIEDLEQLMESKDVMEATMKGAVRLWYVIKVQL